MATDTKTEQGADEKGKEDAGVATRAQNDKLTHSDESAPQTTRDDPTDLGVPMLPGHPEERQGPEDALGLGPKRGDYRKRVHGEHFTTEEVREEDADGITRPRTRLVAQTPNTENIGDVPKLKGGVDTSEDDKPVKAGSASK